MYVANLEADFRSTGPAAQRGTAGNGDFFAELLRQHREANEPAPQAKDAAPRSGPRSQPERDPVSPEAKVEQPVEAEVEQPVAAEPSTTAPAASKSEPGAADAADAAPAANEPTMEGDDTVAASGAQGAAPIAAAVIIPPAADPTVAAQPEAPAPTEAPRPAGTVDPAIPQPETTAPSMPLDPAAPTPVPAASGGSETPPPAVAAAAATAPLPAAVPAGPADAVAAPAPAKPGTKPMTPIAAPSAEDGEQISVATGDSATGDPVAKVEVEAKRAPAAALAQGLGKLGSGAEVALAAQAIGEVMRDAHAGKPQAQPTLPQAAGGAPADGALPSTPAAGTAAPAPATPTAPASAAPGAAATQQNSGESRPSFEAALGAVTVSHENAGMAPGTFGDGSLRAVNAAGAAAASPARAAVHAAPAEQVAIQIQRSVREGGNRITVQLNPAELGQVEVRLDFDQQGRVSATVLADRSDTLDMLQRDARVLERSLQDAGLKTDSGSLSFDLRDGGRNGAGSQQQTAGGFRDGNAAQARPERPAAVEAGATQPMMAGPADGGVDIRV